MALCSRADGSLKTRFATQHFGDASHLLKAVTLASQRDIQVDSLEAIDVNKRHLFAWDYANKVMRNDLFTALLQDIFRVAIRNVGNDAEVNKDTKVSIWVFQTDDEMIKAVQSKMPGSVLEGWSLKDTLIKHPEIELTDEDELSILVRRAIYEELCINKAPKVRKVLIRKKAGISNNNRSQFSEVLSRDYVVKWLADNKVRATHHEFVRVDG